MRQLIAALVLLCFGITVPMGATQLRICLLDGQLMASGDSCADEAKKDSCCPDSSDESESCCAEVKKLPDLNLRSGDADLSAPMLEDLPFVSFPGPPALSSEFSPYHPSVPIRGPDSPSAQRAVLAVWII